MDKRQLSIRRTFDYLRKFEFGKFIYFERLHFFDLIRQIVDHML